MSLILYLFSSFLLLTTTLATTSDWPIPNYNNCSFYQKAEALVKCKAKGSDYLLSYGQYYCEVFRKKIIEWKDRTKLITWTNDTGQCLQEMLFDNRKKRLGPPCDQLEEFAYDAHPICYKQYGVCELDLKDKLSIFNSVRLIHMITRRSVAQIDNVLLACLEDWISPEEDATYSRIFQGTNSQPEDTRLLAITLLESAPFSSKSARKDYFKKLLPEIIFNSSSLAAVDASQEFLKQFKSDGSTLNSEINQDANDCLYTNPQISLKLDRCDPRIRKKLNVLYNKHTIINKHNELTKDRLNEVIRKMNSNHML